MKRYVTLVTTCPVQSHKFPFDYHQCNFKLGARDLKEHELKLSVKKMNYYSVRTDVPKIPLTDIKLHLGRIINMS